MHSRRDVRDLVGTVLYSHRVGRARAEQREGVHRGMLSVVTVSAVDAPSALARDARDTSMAIVTNRADIFRTEGTALQNGDPVDSTEQWAS